ncbi:hypothetical protein NV377_17865 [Paenibacillus sp. T3-5-0-4]|nr:hypothetical protein [Paenibacillus endoradicis]
MNFPNEMTTEEFLTLVSTFLARWVNNSTTKLIIKEMRIGLVSDGMEYDLSHSGKEAVFKLSIETEENVISHNKKQRKIEVPLIKLSEWMFTKDKEFHIPPGIDLEIDYVGDTKVYYSDDVLPVYSIESYCRNKEIIFLKNPDYKYVQKSIAIELISKDVLDRLKTIAIYSTREGLSECIKLNDLELAFGKPILHDKYDTNTQYVTLARIKKLEPYLKIKKPYGKQYSYFDKSDHLIEQFTDIYDLYELLEDNGLFVITQNEFIENHYIKYLSDYDLSTFPKEMKIKEKAVVCGGFIDNSFSTTVRPLYKTEKILSESSYTAIIPDESLKKEYLCCPVRFLHKLKNIINKEKGINYNNLIPLGLTTKYDLIFTKIPLHINEEIKQYIMFKEKQDELNKMKYSF